MYTFTFICTYASIYNWRTWRFRKFARKKISKKEKFSISTKNHTFVYTQDQLSTRYVCTCLQMYLHTLICTYMYTICVAFMTFGQIFYFHHELHLHTHTGTTADKIGVYMFTNVFMYIDMYIYIYTIWVRDVLAIYYFHYELHLHRHTGTSADKLYVYLLPTQALCIYVHACMHLCVNM